MITSLCGEDADNHIKAAKHCGKHDFTAWQTAWCSIPAIENPQASIGEFRYCKKCGRLQVVSFEVLGGDYPIDVSKLTYSNGWRP